MDEKETIMGHQISCYDNGGESIDRYTVVFWDQPEMRANTYVALAMSANPFHPQGFGQHTQAMPGKHLGKSIPFATLPNDCQQLVKQEFIDENEVTESLSRICELAGLLTEDVYKDREDYLKRMAEKYELDIDNVRDLADSIEPGEDFDEAMKEGLEELRDAENNQIFADKFGINEAVRDLSWDVELTGYLDTFRTIITKLDDAGTLRKFPQLGRDIDDIITLIEKQEATLKSLKEIGEEYADATDRISYSNNAHDEEQYAKGQESVADEILNYFGSGDL